MPKALEDTAGRTEARRSGRAALRRPMTWHPLTFGNMDQTPRCARRHPDILLHENQVSRSFFHPFLIVDNRIPHLTKMSSYSSVTKSLYIFPLFDVS